MTASTNTTIPAPRDESRGFFMRMGRHASEAWPLAMEVIEQHAGEEFEAIGPFLDSYRGRGADALEAL